MRDRRKSPEGGSARSFLHSLAWNYLGYLFEFVAGALLLAYVVRRISVEDYGIYLLAQSLAALLSILDLGLSSVLVQLYVSTLASRGLQEAAALAGMVFLWLLGVGALGAGALCAAAMLLPRLVHLPSEHAALALRVLVVAAATVPLVLPAVSLEHLCQALERFDRVNQVQIGSVALRVVLTVAVLSAGKGIVALAAVQAVVALARLLGLWAVTQGLLGELRLPLWSFRVASLREALGASGWAFGDDLLRRIGMNVETMALAALSSFQQVALFGVGSRLPAHLFQFAMRGLTVMMPGLSRQHAEGDSERLRESFRNAYRVCLTGLAPLAIFGALCARPLLEIWAGRAYSAAAPVLAWLLVSALSQVTELPSDLVLYSHDRIARAARFSLWETAGKVAFALALARPFGAAGVAAGVALWHWGVNLFGYLPEACRVARMHPLEPWRDLLLGWRTPGGALQAAVFAVAAVVLASSAHRLPAAWSFALCAALGLLYAAVWAVCTALPMWKTARASRALAAEAM
jgi:O-antigen/teichoic acid export membrane protein